MLDHEPGTRVASRLSAASVKISPMAELTIAIATGPSGGLSLASEIRLVKPALLYADSVTLISPVATLLQAAVDVGASEDLTMALFRQVGPTLDPVAAEAFARFDELRCKPRPSREETRRIAEFRELMARGAEEIYATSRALMAEAGADERDEPPTRTRGVNRVITRATETGRNAMASTSSRSLRFAADSSATPRCTQTADRRLNPKVAGSIPARPIARELARVSRESRGTDSPSSRETQDVPAEERKSHGQTARRWRRDRAGLKEQAMPLPNRWTKRGG